MTYKEEKELSYDILEPRESLIDLIKWYRDVYHKTDWCHSDYIQQIESGATDHQVECIEQVVDGWLDWD